MGVFGTIHPCMYGIRWYIQYQYSFDRPGKEKMSKIFRTMEEEENSRDWDKGEHVLVDGLMDGLHTDKFPRAHDNTTSDNIALAEKLKYWTDKGVVQVRGETIPNIPASMLDASIVRDLQSTDSNNISVVGCLDGLTDPLERTTLLLSPVTQKMFANDDEHILNSIELTQESQKTAMKQVLDSNLSKDQKGMSIFRDTMKKIDTCPDMVDDYLLEMHELNMKYTSIATAKRNSNKRVGSTEKCSSKKRGSSYGKKYSRYR
jgi:hypothetical protein